MMIRVLSLASVATLALTASAYAQVPTPYTGYQGYGANPYGAAPYGATYPNPYAGAYPYPAPGYYPAQPVIDPYAAQAYAQQQAAAAQAQALQQQAVTQAQAQAQAQQLQSQRDVAAVTASNPGPAVPHSMNPDFSRYAPGAFGDAAKPAAISKQARATGIRAGYAEEAANIVAHLRQPEISARFDARYPFDRVVLPGHVVPPVISEIHDVKRTEGPRYLALTLGYFEIVRPARLAVRPPSWRDYLMLDVDPATTTRPVNINSSAERAAWDSAYEEGRIVGINEARATFEIQFNRLDRDYAGMVRYGELAAQGAVSLPKTTRTKTAVRLSDRGQKAHVNEQIVKLVVTPSFVAKRPASYE